MLGTEDFARFYCHKRVRAAKIRAIEDHDKPLVFVIETALGAERTFIANDDFARRVHAGDRKPQAGDYIIAYEGGFLSWSPADLFEASYTREVA